MISEDQIDSMKLDEIDVQIISMLEEDPTLTHSEIARRIDRSQPAVGSRIHKLEERGILRTQIGVDFKKFDIYLVKVEIFTKDPEEVMIMARKCPFVINAMKITGERNICILLAATDLKKLDTVVDYHFRDNKDVQKVKMEMVTDYANPFILPVNFITEYHEPNTKVGCGDKCWRHIEAMEKAQKTK